MRLRGIALATLLISHVGTGQTSTQRTIETRKVRTLIDRDGKGFSRAPRAAVPIASGRFALAEMNEIPLVVDSTGRLVKRWPTGHGPGEFETNSGPFAVGKGDTLFVGNHNSVNVFDRNLKFVRSIPLTGLYAGSFVAIDEGLLLAAKGRPTGQTMQSLHVVSPTGEVIRSFLTDTLVRPQRGMDPEYRVAAGSGKTFWAWPLWGHRLERWNTAGERLALIDTTPAWFPQKDPLYKSTVITVREADGVLWVLSSIPVPNAREQAMASVKGSGEVDARAVPFEQLATSYLEAYDAKSGNLLGELPIKAYGITILDDRHFMIYTTSATDTAQLEIWEMKLK